MAGITAAQAQTNLDAWLAASEAVAQNQSYTIDTGGVRRQLTRADATEIRNMISFWQGWVTRLSGTRRRTTYVVPE
jgi:hypothetical protein